MKTKWNAPESMDGKRTIKIHAYTDATREIPYIGEEYQGNKALCNRRLGIVDGGDRFVKLEDIESDPLIIEKACKTCLKISNEVIRPKAIKP